MHSCGRHKENGRKRVRKGLNGTFEALQKYGGVLLGIQLGIGNTHPQCTIPRTFCPLFFVFFHFPISNQVQNFSGNEIRVVSFWYWSGNSLHFCPPGNLAIQEVSGRSADVFGFPNIKLPYKSAFRSMQGPGHLCVACHNCSSIQIAHWFQSQPSVLWFFGCVH